MSKISPDPSLKKRGKQFSLMAPWLAVALVASGAAEGG
jgi:hypothetical protein